MAATSLINQILQVGQESAPVVIAESDERVYLRLAASQKGTAESQVRLIAKDSLGRIKADILINGTGTEERSVDQIDSALTVTVECHRGEALVTASQLTGLEGATGSSSALGTADIADLGVTTAKLAAAAVTTAKLGPAAAALTKLGLTGIKVLRFDGAATAGSITLTGAAVGDRVLACWGTTVSSGVSVVGGTDFESVITVVDEIQQSLASDLTGNDYWVILIPAAA